MDICSNRYTDSDKSSEEDKSSSGDDKSFHEKDEDYEDNSSTEEDSEDVNQANREVKQSFGEEEKSDESRSGEEHVVKEKERQEVTDLKRTESKVSVRESIESVEENISSAEDEEIKELSKLSELFDGNIKNNKISVLETTELMTTNEPVETEIIESGSIDMIEKQTIVFLNESKIVEDSSVSNVLTVESQIVENRISAGKTSPENEDKPSKFNPNSSEIVESISDEVFDKVVSNNSEYVGEANVDLDDSAIVANDGVENVPKQILEQDKLVIENTPTNATENESIGTLKENVEESEMTNFITNTENVKSITSGPCDPELKFKPKTVQTQLQAYETQTKNSIVRKEQITSEPKKEVTETLSQLVEMELVKRRSKAEPGCDLPKPRTVRSMSENLLIELNTVKSMISSIERERARHRNATSKNNIQLVNDNNDDEDDYNDDDDNEEIVPLLQMSNTELKGTEAAVATTEGCGNSKNNADDECNDVRQEHDEHGLEKQCWSTLFNEAVIMDDNKMTLDDRFKTIEQAHRALELLEDYHSRLSEPQDRALRIAIERVIRIFKSRLFQALLDIQEFYELTLLDDSKTIQQKTAETLQIASKWEQEGHSIKISDNQRFKIEGNTEFSKEADNQRSQPNSPEVTLNNNPQAAPEFSSQHDAIDQAVSGEKLKQTINRNQSQF